jgi:hypothetical protein
MEIGKKSHDNRCFDGNLNQTYLQRIRKRDPSFLVRWDFVDVIKAPCCMKISQFLNRINNSLLPDLRL